MNFKKIALAFSVIAILGCNQQNSDDKEKIVKRTELSSSLEYKIASIDAGTELSEQDYTISNTKEILKEAELTYGIPKERIADIAAKGQQILKEKNISVKITDLIEAALIICDSKCKEDDFVDNISNYVMLRSNSGQNHYQTVHAIVILNNINKRK